MSHNLTFPAPQLDDDQHKRTQVTHVIPISQIILPRLSNKFTHIVEKSNISKETNKIRIYHILLMIIWNIFACLIIYYGFILESISIHRYTTYLYSVCSILFLSILCIGVFYKVKPRTNHNDDGLIQDYNRGVDNNEAIQKPLDDIIFLKWYMQLLGIWQPLKYGVWCKRIYTFIVSLSLWLVIPFDILDVIRDHDLYSIWYLSLDIIMFITYCAFLYALSDTILIKTIWNIKDEELLHSYMYKWSYFWILPIICLSIYCWFGSIFMDMLSNDTWVRYIIHMKYLYDLSPTTGTNFEQNTALIPTSIGFMLSIFWYSCKVHTLKLRFLKNKIINGNMTISEVLLEWIMIEKRVKILQHKFSWFIALLFVFGTIIVIVTFVAMFSPEFDDGDTNNQMVTALSSTILFSALFVTVYFAVEIEYEAKGIIKCLSCFQSMYLYGDNDMRHDICSVVEQLEKKPIMFKVFVLELNGAILVRVASILIIQMVALLFKNYLSVTR